MKLSSISIGLVTLFLSFPFTSTGQNTSESKLTGAWSFNYEAAFESMNNDTKAVFNSLNEAPRKAVENLYKDRQMIFGNDNTFKLVLSDGRSSEGVWELNPNGKILKIKNEATSKVYPYKVLMISEEKLIIEELETKSNAYFKALHFVKLNH